MICSIETHKLSKNYHKTVALDGVDLSVPTGKIYGLIGPNGAGKTTLIKLLAGLLKPTSGTTKVLGLDPIKDATKLTKIIGYMPQSPSLYEDLSTRDNLTFFAKAMNVKNVKRKVADMLEFVELTKRANDRVYSLSGGMKKRVSLACTLIHKPKVIFLDEPTAAIDPELKAKTWDLFRKLADEGSTIFVSTHMMEEAMNCDHIAILIEGKIVAVLTPSEYKGKGKLNIKLISDKNKETVETISANPEKVADFLKKFGLSGVKSVKIEEEGLEKILLGMVKK